MKQGRPYILGIGGTTRPGSSTETALRCSLRAAEANGAATHCVGGKELAKLPLYAPEQPSRTAAARALVEEVRRADGLVIASPGYHGSISGLVKNALDYIEDLRDDKRVYLSDLPVGVIATGSGPQAVTSTLAALRSVVHALRGWPTPMGAGVVTVGRVFDEAGDCLDSGAAFQLRKVGEQVITFARRQAARPAVPAV